MANTQYRSPVPITRANVAKAFRILSDLMEHLDAWNIDLVAINRPTTGPNAGHIVITISDPIPTEQLAHLLVTPV